MLSGKPLFPGRDYHHQLSLILDVLGTPTLDEFYAITTRRSRDYIRALPFRKKKPFQTIFPNASALAADFLTKTLVLLLLARLASTLTPDVTDVRSKETDYRRTSAGAPIPRGLRAYDMGSSAVYGKPDCLLFSTTRMTN